MSSKLTGWRLQSTRPSGQCLESSRVLLRSRNYTFDCREKFFIVPFCNKNTFSLPGSVKSSISAHFVRHEFGRDTVP